MQRLHPRAVWLFLIGHIITVMILIVFLIIVILFILLFASPEGGAFIYENTIIKAGGLAPFMKSIYKWRLGFIILVIILGYIYAKLQYKFYKYELTEKSFRVEQGVIWKKYVSLPYEKIQNVDIGRGITARILGLSNIQVHTAGYGAGGGEASVPGLLPQRAEELREELIRRVKTAKQ
jgi:uncharacterized membrane protein YdbT with pleckstrin-like domain